MSNLYCLYDKKIYKANLKGEKILIFSSTKKDGFINYIDILGNEHTDFFVKELKLSEVELVFKPEIYVQYCDRYFRLYSSVFTDYNIANRSFCLFTDQQDLADKYSFEKKGQFEFVLDISFEKAEKIKIIQTPVKEFQGSGQREIIIENNKIDEWFNTKIIF